MKRIVIKGRVSRYSHPGLLAFAQNVAAKMEGNLNYLFPNPPLATVNSIITAYRDALKAWGPQENRGSHLEHQVVLDTRRTLEETLLALISFCENVTPFDKSAFLSAGWEVRKEWTPVGIVGPVIGLHQFISRVVPSGAVKLRWKRPENVSRGSIYLYRIMHSQTADIRTAVQIGLSRPTTFTDAYAGNRLSNFYWVIPVCHAGDGGVAEVVQGYPQGPVMN